MHCTRLVVHENEYTTRHGRPMSTRRYASNRWSRGGKQHKRTADRDVGFSDSKNFSEI